MPVGGIHGGITADRSARSGGSGTGTSRGLRGLNTRAGMLDAEGRDLGRIGGGQGARSANAGIGTYARDRQGLNAAYGGPVDDSGFIGRMLGYRTYNNPISNQYAGSTLDMGNVIGGVLGLGLGMPGLSALGGMLSPAGMNVGFGPEMGAWRTGGQAGTGGPGMMGGGRGAPGGGMGAPGLGGVNPVAPTPPMPPGMMNTPQGFPTPQTPATGLMQFGQPGYSVNSRFGRATMPAYSYG